MFKYTHDDQLFYVSFIWFMLQFRDIFIYAHPQRKREKESERILVHGVSQILKSFHFLCTNISFAVIENVCKILKFT